MLEPRVGRVGNDEEHVHESDQTNFAGPLVSVDGDFPWVNITEFLACKDFGVVAMTENKENVHTSRTPGYCREWTCQRSPVLDGRTP